MKKLNRMLVIFSVLTSMILCQFSSYAFVNNDENANYLSNEEVFKINKFISETMDEGKIPGLTITVVKGDKTIYQKCFGYSDVDSKKTVNPKSLFEIGSNSKAFTALGILNLENDGQIKLEDEISKYLPWFKVKYKGKEASITIEQLLHHTSGVPFNTIDKIPVSNSDNAIEETVKTLIDIELDSKPGKSFQYATINYDVLGLVIEKVTGLSYEKYIEEYILKPMALSNTYVNKNEAISENIVKGYKLEFLKANEYDAPVYRGNKPAGYILSCGDDMEKWLKIQMGTLSDSSFTKDLVEKSHEGNRNVKSLANESYYAAGWVVSENDMISHAGNNPNFSSYIVFHPKDKIGIAVLSNMNSSYTEIIANGVDKILKSENYDLEINDLNKIVDNISIGIILLAFFIVLAVSFLMMKLYKDVVNKKRFLKKIGVRSILKLIFSLIFMIVLSYCIYLIPNILYSGVSWGFVFVWLPSSLRIALYLVYLAIWLIYIYIVLSSLIKKPKDKGIIILSILSIVSGFGNALIIFTINMSLNSNNDLKIKLFLCFILGIILYVYGQKIMRQKLIDLTNEIVYLKRMEIVEKLLESSFNKFEEVEKGRIQSTLNNDTETISRFVNILIGGITSAVTLICCFIYLGTIDVYALFLSILIILIIASIYYLVGRYANKLGEESRDLQNLFFKFIEDLIGGFKELSLNENKKNEFKNDMEKSCAKYKSKRSKSALAFANMFVIGELLFTLAIGSVVFIFPFILKNLDSTSLTSYVFVLLYMTGPVHGILNTIPNAIEVKISLKRINSLIDEITESKIVKVNNLNNNIVDQVSLKIKDVEYEYAKTDGKSFKIGPINYEFNSGEVVFITGGNGSGKSTFAKLLTGLYLPAKGEISLNGTVSQKQLGENYSTVFSDFYLFDKLYGINYQGKESEIQRYLEILQINDKVQIRDGKFSTTKLSTGQKKRLALLVTYLEDRPIYLFDEWAADQDPEFRLFFYDTLLPNLKAKGKCVIAVTHDDRYFNLADKVIKMELGRISNS